MLLRLTDSDERGHSNGDKSLGPQARIQRRYEMATLELGEALSRLDKVLPINEINRFQPSVEMSLQSSAPTHRCIIMPPIRISRLFDRLDVFVQLDELLTVDGGESALQSVALHGLGGVGKSSIASSYAEKKFTEQVYDVVLWIRAEKEASLRQSFTEIAMRLKLPGTQPHSHDENQILVQDWFQSTGTQ